MLTVLPQVSCEWDTRLAEELRTSPEFGESILHGVQLALFPNTSGSDTVVLIEPRPDGAYEIVTLYSDTDRSAYVQDLLYGWEERPWLRAWPHAGSATSESGVVEFLQEAIDQLPEDRYPLRVIYSKGDAVERRLKRMQEDQPGRLTVAATLAWVDRSHR